MSLHNDETDAPDSRVPTPQWATPVLPQSRFSHNIMYQTKTDAAYIIVRPDDTAIEFDPKLCPVFPPKEDALNISMFFATISVSMSAAVGSSLARMNWSEYIKKLNIENYFKKSERYNTDDVNEGVLVVCLFDPVPAK